MAIATASWIASAGLLYVIYQCFHPAQADVGSVLLFFAGCVLTVVFILVAAFALGTTLTAIQIRRGKR